MIHWVLCYLTVILTWLHVFCNDTLRTSLPHSDFYLIICLLLWYTVCFVTSQWFLLDYMPSVMIHWVLCYLPVIFTWLYAFCNDTLNTLLPHSDSYLIICLLLWYTEYSVTSQWFLLDYMPSVMIHWELCYLTVIFTWLFAFCYDTLNTSLPHSDSYLIICLL